jgi:osmotically-inducible protein OsmY
MKSNFFFFAAPAVIGFLALSSSVQAQGPAGYVGNGQVANPSSGTTQTAAAAPTTADSDKQITQQIRDAIAADKSLSAEARSVKIVTQNGRVVLRGAVASDDERTTIVAKAAGIAGRANVDNRLNVAAPAKS